MPSLRFKGRTFVENHHLAVPFHELKPSRARGLTRRASLHDNLIVAGDNLAALKALLPTYHRKVKCIYIDPPYNTGNEGWAYNDRVDSPMMRHWLGKVVDREDLTRHDKWCCMMLPRLKLLRELLRDDGAIFVSIDDNEVHRLRCLMDEVFGEDNFVGMIAWRNVTDNNPTNISIEHEYIACYAASKELLESVWQSTTLPIKDKLVETGKEFIDTYTDDDARQAAYTKWYREHKTELGPLDRYKYIDVDSITAERVRRVVKGVPAAKDPALRAGLGGAFSYFELGGPMRQESLLDGSALPGYETLAAYVFFTATGEEFEEERVDRESGFIGRSRLYDVFLIYEPDVERLKNLALTLDLARALPQRKGRRRLVFAPTKYLDEDFLDEYRITFQQLPFQVYETIAQTAGRRARGAET